MQRFEKLEEHLSVVWYPNVQRRDASPATLPQPNDVRNTAGSKIGCLHTLEAPTSVPQSYEVLTYLLQPLYQCVTRHRIKLQEQLQLACLLASIYACGSHTRCM